MDINAYLKLMVEQDASDLFFSTGTPVHVKVEGISRPIGDAPLQPGMVKAAAYALMNVEQQRVFEEKLEMNLGIPMKDVGRFRVNIYRQRGEVAMVIRFLKARIPSIETLNLPLILKDLVREPRGLILVVGATGSGKSTTLASMIEHRNIHCQGHILTIEDPIEYVHQHKKSVVDQREVGLDTLSYSNALENAMREAPDVILIGEIRDRETMQHAIAYSETGHLCLSTLHSNNANQAIERIVNFFPEKSHHQLFIDLSLNLRAIISQRLLKGVDGKRIPAVEVMLNTPYISDLIEKGEIDQIKTAMGQSSTPGMQVFDDALYELYTSGQISREEALQNADSKNNLSLRIRLAESGQSASGTDDFDLTDQ